MLQQEKETKDIKIRRKHEKNKNKLGLKKFSTSMSNVKIKNTAL